MTRRRKATDAAVPDADGAPGPEVRERISRSFLALALSHELKQPLNSLNLNVELMSKRLAKLPGGGGDTAGPLAAMGRVVERVVGCLESFTVHVQPDPVPKDPVDIRPLLAAAAARADASARRSGVRVVVADIEDDVPEVSVHPDQIAVALDALIDNAVLASAKGGQVEVRARFDGDDVHLEVVDRGSGMTPEVARRAVEIGFTTRGSRGVGLTVAKFVAYHHGGGFHMESRPGTGTTASLVIPAGE